MSVKTAEPILASVNQTAKLLNLSRATVYRLSAEGKLPEPVRIGGSLRFDVAELKAWIAAGAPSRETWAELKGA